MANQKKKADSFKRLSQDRADLIADLLDKFEELVIKSSVKLTEAVIKEFAEQLSVENGVILTDEQNMRRVALIEKAWNTFTAQQNVKIVATFIDDLSAITEENLKYYRTLSDAQIKPSDIKNVINARLGLDENGTPKKGGYMKGLMDDVSVRNQITKYAYAKVTTGAGYTDMLRGLSTLIQGDTDNLGAFGKFYRNFAYDTYTGIDRLNNAMFAEKLNLRYFIFQGTRRDGSRHFCLERKGKVFSTEEAEEWVHLIGKTILVDGKTKKIKKPIGPIVEDKATYNPILDLGGIGCVDVASFISEEIAFQLRPDLRNKAKVSEDYAVQHEGKHGAKVYKHADADAKDADYNVRYGKILADNGISVKIKKHINVRGAKNPELQLLDGRIADFKEPDKDANIKTAISNIFKRSRSQGVDVPIIVLNSKTYDKKAIIERLIGSITPKLNKSINEVWFVYKGQLIKISREEVYDKSFISRLP